MKCLKEQLKKLKKEGIIKSMKSYTLSEALLLRTPLLSLNGYMANVLKDNTLEALRYAYQDEAIQKALFLASPVLFEENKKWQRGEVTGNEETRLAQALWRYLLRMSSRCTPFGLFAGVTMGKWANYTNIVLEKDKYQAHTRLDMEYLGALAQELSRFPEVRAKLRYFPNNSIYVVGGRLRYVDYHYKEKRRVHQIVAIDDSHYVQAVLERAVSGALPSELSQVLVSEDINYEEAAAFIEEMIDAQVLISELDGKTTTSKTSVNQLSEKLEGALKEYIDYLLNPAHYQFPPSDLFKEKLAAVGVPFELSKLFQTDLEKSAQSCCLDKKIAGSLRRGLSLLNRLSIKPRETNMSKFAEAFLERYETKELPLLEVLDIETGIGYVQRGNTQGDINPLVDDLMIGVTAGEQKLDWNSKQVFLFKKLLEAHQEKAYKVNLEFKEVEKFEEHWEDVSPSISLMFSVLSQEEGKHPTVILENGGGQATRLLGRFTTMNNEILTWCESIAAAEQAAFPNDTIIAEIVHLPENRVGNILMRKQFRTYEIPYLAQASVAEEFKIPLQDLMVSVRNGEVVLRSKRLQKRIIPALSNAHNYSYNSLPVYHFLCDLQSQNLRSGFGFHWGNMSNQFKFLPRVCFENLILHRATWQLQKADFEMLTQSKPNELMQNIAIWRNQWSMPERILIVQGDNELLIDLRHELSAQTLVQEVKNLPNVTLAEFLFLDENAITKDEHGECYTNEFVAVFLRDNDKVGKLEMGSEKRERNKRETIQNKRPTTARSFSTGSEWLYFKVYCGAATGDELLCSHIYPLAQQLLEADFITHWFFIRYADPKNHLRVRFLLKNQAALGKVTQAFYDAIEIPLQQRKIWKLQTDTYEREIERYGAETMELSEQLFFQDSMTTLEFLNNLEHFQSDYRWLYGIAAIDALLDAFDFSLERKIKLLEHLKTSFGQEFGMNKHLRKQLNEKYAKFELQIAQLFSKSYDENLLFLQDAAALKKELITPIALNIKELCNENEARENDLLGSYIHMTLNRLFKAKQRLYEMVVYDFAFKNYQKMVYMRKKIK